MQLAQHSNAALHVLAVIQEPPWYTVRWSRKLPIQARLMKLRREREDYLETLVAPLQVAGITVSIQATIGPPWLEIIRAVIRHNHDLVVKTAATETGVRKAFFGSTDMHLLRKCPGALWLLKPTEAEHYRSILVAVEAEVEEQEKFIRNARLVRLATALAHAEGASLFVVSAWTTFAENKLRAHLAPAQFRHYIRESQQKAAQKLRTFFSLAAGDISHPRLHLVPGDPDAVIPHLANTRSVDLVVMGTPGRSGILGLWSGRTAEKILHRLECSLFTMKPVGFRSPVS